MRRRVLVPLLAVIAASGLVLGTSVAVAGASVSAAKPAPCAGKTKEKAVKQIKATWDIFLNGAAGRTLDERKVVVQGADDPALLELFNSIFAANADLAAMTTTRVDKVTCTSKKQADVEFFLINTTTGDPLLPDAQAGAAVIEDGMWKVSTEAVCSLIALAQPASIESGPCALT